MKKTREISSSQDWRSKGAFYFAVPWELITSGKHGHMKWKSYHF